MPAAAGLPSLGGQNPPAVIRGDTANVTAGDIALGTNAMIRTDSKIDLTQ
jgi:hypothetical protein